MLIKIWERYFLKEFLKVFFLFLFCFYGLYVLIDYANHTSAFSNQQVNISWHGIASYYLFIFASRAEVLIPLALLIAFVKTVCTLNIHQELVALLASGIPLKTLMRPFLWAGFISVILLYSNEQFLLPHALKKLRKIENLTKHQRKRQTLSLTVKHIILEDESLLIFQDYDSLKERFFDVFWIQSIDNIYRIKYLSPTPPTGYFVDHLVRQPTGELLQEAAYESLVFPDMRFNPEILHSTISDPETLTLSEITMQAVNISSDASEKESKLLTAFYWKLVIPWLCLLAILAPAPFCIRFSRQVPIFLLYVCSLFGLIAFYMLMDAAQVIAKRQVFSPMWVILGPFVPVFSYFGWRFAKMA